MKAISRIPIFSYNTISTTLLIPTKSLEIKLRKNHLSNEMLFELESILAWCATHTEVQSLYMTSYGEEFIQGFDPVDLSVLSEEKIKKQFQKLSTIAQTLMCLPQTVVIDMKKGARNVGLELSLAADIRVAHKDAVFCLDYLSNGLIPTCGLFSFLRPNLNQNTLRSLLLSGIEFNKEALLALGGYTEFDADVQSILTHIFTQAPIARMQSKLGLFGLHSENKNHELELEKKLFNAVIHSKDYSQKSGNFMTVNEFKEKLNVNNEQLV